MKLNENPSSPAAGSAKFDLLRVRLEAEVARPAVIALTSSTAEDGREIAARALAFSLATAGYSTLFVETSLASGSQSKSSPGLTLDEIGRLQSTPAPEPGIIAVLTLNDLTLQRTTGQRGLQSALEILRSKFDYVVISTGCGAATSFAESILSVADAVIVTVKKGRREDTRDAQLSANLEHVGSRFLGVVALDPSIIKADQITPVPAAKPDTRRTPTAQTEKEPRNREIAESWT
jgi:Mrp family chromosome partitioning ATPase